MSFLLENLFKEELKKCTIKIEALIKEAKERGEQFDKNLSQEVVIQQYYSYLKYFSE